MLSDAKSNRMRFTKAELENLRKRAARNGYRIVQIENHIQAMEALVKALPYQIAKDMLQHMETGASPLTSGAALAQLRSALRNDSHADQIP